MKKDYVSLKRRPFLMPIWLAAAALAVVGAAVGFSAWVWSTADSTIVIVIRNAESEAGGLAARSLSAQGARRAERLARMFDGGKSPAALGAIYVQPTLRGRLTVEPLAKRLGLSAVAVGEPGALVRRALADHAGGSVLIVASGRDVPLIVAALLGAPQVPPVGDADYGSLYIVAVPRIGRANILRMHY